MANDQQSSDDTTRVVDQPEPGYFQPLRTQRVAEQQQQSPVDPKCNRGTCLGESVAECAECQPEAAEHRASEIEMENNQLREALAAARQASENLRNHHKHMAAEFELIAAGKHPRYWTLEPGDVLFRSVGNRTPRYGDYYGFLHGRGIDQATSDWFDTPANHLPIYRRIDAPAAAEAGESPCSFTEIVSCEPAPAAAEVEDIVEHGGKRYRREAVARLPKKGELFWHQRALVVMRARFDYETGKHHVVHEITEPLPPPVSEQKPSLQQVTELVREHGSFHKAQIATNAVPPVSEQEGERASDKLDRFIESCSAQTEATIREQAEEIERLKAQIESLKTKPSVDDYVQAFEESTRPTVAPAEASEGMNGNSLEGTIGEQGLVAIAPAPAAESGKWEMRFTESGKRVLSIDGGEATTGEAISAADWLNRRAEIESQLAQLAKYKRDAEALEKRRGNCKSCGGTGGAYPEGCTACDGTGDMGRCADCDYCAWVISAETGKVLFCKVCDERQQKNDFKTERDEALGKLEAIQDYRKAISAIETHNMLLDRGIGAFGRPVWAARATVNNEIIVGPWKRFVLDAVLALAASLSQQTGGKE